MIKFCKDQWNANRERLEEALRGDTQLNTCDYRYLLSLVVEHILNPGLPSSESRWSARKITTIDDGDYQGTLMFLIPKDCYQPSESEYLLTFIDYGSCSGCDTLMGIQGLDNVPPTEQQLKDYMVLCKALVENMVKPYNDGWRKDERYNTVELEEN
jgi:hypothetical protein